MRLVRLTMIATLVAMLGLLTAVPASAQTAVRVHLLHGIPDTPVDVYVDGGAVIEGFEFGDAQDLSAFAGVTLENVEVRLAGTETVAIAVPSLAIPSSGNFTAVAHLDAEGTPSLAVFENDTSAIAAGEGRLVVRHAAAAPEVDILANGDVAFAAVPNGAEGSVDLATGTVTAEVVPAGATEPVVIGPADLPIVDGSSLIVYAVGSLDGGSLTVLTETIEGLGSTPTVVNTGNSAVDDGVAPWFVAALGLIAFAGVAGAIAAPRLARERI